MHPDALKKYCYEKVRMTSKYITHREIIEAVENAKIIEDYPDDKYGPSCLIYGKTILGRPLHIHCSYPSRPKIKIITVYEPNPDEWSEYQKRREKNEM